METNDTLPLNLDIAPLTPARAESLAIGPDTEVLCINRSQDVLEDMHDSVPFQIAPGYFTVQYAGARHFQSRQIVPGSRNPELRTFESYIGIIGLVKTQGGAHHVLKRVDPAEKCQPFTAEECAKLSLKHEAIDREHLMMPMSPGAELIDVADVRVSMAGSGATVSRGGDRIVDPGANDQVPADQHEGIQSAAAAVGDRAAEAAADRSTAPTESRRRR